MPANSSVQEQMRSTALERQKQIFLSGISGRKPRIPTSFEALEKRAGERLNPSAFAYVAGGAGSEKTMHRNRTAFDEVRIVPRMLRGVEQRSTAIELFGRVYPTPFLLAPVGVLELFDRRADLAVAKAAANTRIPYIFSSQASKTMEACANAMADHPRWFQLYWSKSRDLVQSFVKRAEACNCQAIVVTLDTTLLGWRPRDLNLGFLPFLKGMGIAQYTSDPIFNQHVDDFQATDDTSRGPISWKTLFHLVQLNRTYPGSFWRNLRTGRPLKAVKTFIDIYSNPALNWSDLAFLQSITDLPILLKGILHPDDAKRAIDHGVRGIIVSNHGGRQVDGSVSSLEMLGEIIASVENTIPVLLDSGIRGGADAFKALAMGARAVCIGRPYVYGLSLDGQRGVETVLRNYLADFELTMALSGCASIREIDHTTIRYA